MLIKAQPVGPVCHTGNDTCFNESNKADPGFLIYLQDLIDQRMREMPEGSYTTKLFSNGINKIAQKVGEEANEAADLMYHTLVLLTAKGFHINDVIQVLSERHK